MASSSSILLLLCALAACLKNFHFVSSSYSDFGSDININSNIDSNNILHNSHDITNPSPLPDLCSPDKYTIYFHTNVVLHGGIEADPFVVDVTRARSPIGADRLYSLVKDNYFTNATFFRVVPDFVVQFGIASQPSESSKWNTNIKDDPVLVTNAKWTLVYAKTNSPNSRTTQLFINFADNGFLDRQGFSPFGDVVSGHQTLLTIANPTPGVSGGISQDSIYRYGSDWVLKNYPVTNKIKYASIWESTISPSESPSIRPTTISPTTMAPSTIPTYSPSFNPSYVPTTISPTTISPTTISPTTIAPTTIAPTTIAPTTIAPTYLPSESPTSISPTMSPTAFVFPVISAGADRRSKNDGNLVFVAVLFIIFAVVAAAVMIKKGVFNRLLNPRRMVGRSHSPLRQREVDVGEEESNHGFENDEEKEEEEEEEEEEEGGNVASRSNSQSTQSRAVEMGRL